MATYYVKRALEILREEGPVTLYQESRDKFYNRFPKYRRSQLNTKNTT